ncbi:zymogen granule membrane protein 16 [Hippopotamus amphibius kiboko]|uniref:zymogen granule membrane protein 16 n=1 Tax=Hippopotamus amphibius kiboko TaxID=575201 RepID=UPI0025994234|nr:zymogen granule membrane protein 16 [Hippopotamus amphibius kiboko]
MARFALVEKENCLDSGAGCLFYHRHYVGGTPGDLEEIFFYPGVSVVQVSGKYKKYLRRLVFVTDKFPFLPFGKDTGMSFNAVPLYPNTVLRFISGQSGSVIDAIGFHWDTYPSDYENC